MKRNTLVIQLIPIYALVFLALVMAAVFGSKAVSVMAEHTPQNMRHCIVIDAGHGGVDGGATSCTGVMESHLNLQISIRLNDLLHLLGYETKMIRTEDVSIYTSGDTIAAKKISDLKERVRIVNSTENAILLSIHQNYFADGRYSGAQVFYANTPDSENLAKVMQKELINAVNVGSNRQAKQSDGVYLMKHIQCPGVLIECGFLSNSAEEAKLRNSNYQKILCSAIASTVSRFLS